MAVRGDSIVEDLSGFCMSKSLEDFCGLIFCEILSEILEIRDGRLQTLLDLLPPWSTLAVAILAVFDIGKAASLCCDVGFVFHPGGRFGVVFFDF